MNYNDIFGHVCLVLPTISSFVLRKSYTKPPYVIGKSMVSCQFPLKLNKSIETGVIIYRNLL